MRIRKALAGASAALVAGVGLVALEASPVMAADWRCGSGTTNVVCIQSVPQGYNAKFAKRQGSVVYVDFHLQCNNGRWFGDEGAFRASWGNEYTYVFSVGSQGTCHVELIDGYNGTVLLRSPDLSR
jgi:hypothetical protein